MLVYRGQRQLGFLGHGRWQAHGGTRPKIGQSPNRGCNLLGQSMLLRMRGIESSFSSGLAGDKSFLGRALCPEPSVVPLLYERHSDSDNHKPSGDRPKCKDNPRLDACAVAEGRCGKASPRCYWLHHGRAIRGRVRFQGSGTADRRSQQPSSFSTTQKPACATGPSARDREGVKGRDEWNGQGVWETGGRRRKVHEQPQGSVRSMQPQRKRMGM